MVFESDNGGELLEDIGGVAVLERAKRNRERGQCNAVFPCVREGVKRHEWCG